MQLPLLPFLIQVKIIDHTLERTGLKSIAITNYQRYPNKRVLNKWVLMSLSRVCWKWFNIVSLRWGTSFTLNTSSLAHVERLESILYFGQQQQVEEDQQTKYRFVKRLENLTIETPRRYRSLPYAQLYKVMQLISKSTTITKIKYRAQGSELYDLYSWLPKSTLELTYDDSYTTNLLYHSSIQLIERYVQPAMLKKLSVYTSDRITNDKLDGTIFKVGDSLSFNLYDKLWLFGQVREINTNITEVSLRCIFLPSDLKNILENLKSLRVLGLHTFRSNTTPHLGTVEAKIENIIEKETLSIDAVRILLTQSKTLEEFSLCYYPNEVKRFKYKWARLFETLFCSQTGNKSIKSLQISTKYVGIKKIYSESFLNCLATNKTLTFLSLEGFGYERIPLISNILKENNTIKSIVLDAKTPWHDGNKWVHELIPPLLENTTLVELYFTLHTANDYQESVNKKLEESIISKLQSSKSLIRLQVLDWLWGGGHSYNARNCISEPFISQQTLFGQYYEHSSRETKEMESNTTNEHSHYINDEIETINCSYDDSNNSEEEDENQNFDDNLGNETNFVEENYNNDNNIAFGFNSITNDDQYSFDYTLGNQAKLVEENYNNNGNDNNNNVDYGFDDDPFNYSNSNNYIQDENNDDNVNPNEINN